METLNPTMRVANITTNGASASAGLVKYAADRGAGELVVNPASYGPHGKGARVTFTIADSKIGRLLIAATELGICWIGLGDSDLRLEAELGADLRLATVSRDDERIAPYAQTVVDYIGGSAREIAIPIDIRATPFQTAVWRELCAIPWGATRSYGEIARRLGRPDASRAVGHANGSNPLSVIIPCHRAIGANGSLTGYRWGLECKRRLLDCEFFQ